MTYNQTDKMTWTLTAESNWDKCFLDLMECSGSLIDFHYERKDENNLAITCEDADYADALLEKFASELLEEVDNFNKHFSNLP